MLLSQGLKMAPTAVAPAETKCDAPLKKAGGLDTNANLQEKINEIPAEEVEGDDNEDGDEEAAGEGAAGGKSKHMPSGHP